MATVSNTNPAEQQEFPELLATYEVELHNRGELTVFEILLLMKKWCELDPQQSLDRREQGLVDYTLDKLTTRMASLLSLWTSCEDIHLSPADLSELIIYKEAFASIFMASGFRGFAHLKTYLAQKQSNGTLAIPQSKLILLFLMLPIDDLDEQLLELAKKLPQEFYIVLMLAWVNSRYVYTAFGDKVRQQMFLQSDVLASVNANETFIRYFFNAWMHCAYAEGNNRLHLKRNINKMIVNFLQQQGFAQTKLAPRPQRDKPLMLVIHERIEKGHAMYRSYVPYFRHLSDKFQLVSMAQVDLPVELAESVFFQHLKIEYTSDLKQIINMIQQVQPDVIYYPSLGMQHWTGLLCNMRLAPMQVISCGHPDSSQSQTIDYLYYGPDVPFIRSECSEKIICLKNYKFKSWPHDELIGNELSISLKKDGLFHIAINCTVMKLSAQFMDCLEQLQQEFGDRVRFHFFHSMRGFLALQTEVVIKRRLPSALVYSAKNYGDFLQLLKTCHLSLSPFPFGNTNSIFDATVVGLPVVALKQPRMAGYTDFLVLQAFGLEELGIAENVQQYMDKARSLIKEPEVYNKHRETVRAAVQSYLQLPESDQFDASFAEALYATYKEHQKGSRKWVFCWDGEELLKR
jgi:hypothetical protein